MFHRLDSVMRRNTLSSRLTLAAVVVLGALGLAGTSQADPDEGKAAYSENGCARCHSVETQDIEATISVERMRGPDLSHIGSEHDPDWIVGWVKRELTVDDTRHTAPYRGSDDDLQALAQWLATLP